MRLQTKLFTARLPVDILRELETLNKNNGISKTFIIKKALKNYFENEKNK